MGNEQSAGNRSKSQDLQSPTSPSVRASRTIQAFDDAQGNQNAMGRQQSGSFSPDRYQESVCSEAASDMPYVSYTVDKPIGDDSKKAEAAGVVGKRAAYFKSKFMGGPSKSNTASVDNTAAVNHPPPKSKGTLVVVNQKKVQRQETDPELGRLADIPSFLPIIRSSLTNASNKKDPDILERLDYRGLLALCQRYENHMRMCAAAVTTEQAEINKSIRDLDQKTAAVAQRLAERQKKYAKHAERLVKVREMSRSLAKCHLLLNENIEQMEILNNMLPQEERLEPFVWTTG